MLKNLSRTEILSKIRLSSGEDLAYDTRKMKDKRFSESNSQVKNTKPLSHSNDLLCSLRDDCIVPSLTQKQALANTSKARKSQFTSVRVVTKS